MGWKNSRKDCRKAYRIVINTILQLGSELLKEAYANNKKKKQAQELLSELLLEEVRWNLELVHMATNLEKEKVVELMTHLKFSVFDSISSAGIPLAKIFPSDWDNGTPEKFSNYTKNVKTEAQLILRTYHRLRIHHLRLEVKIETMPNSENYLEYLLLESKKVLSE